jgi:hypothetical protein
MKVFNVILGVFVLAKLINKFIDGYSLKNSSNILPNHYQRRIQPVLYNYSNGNTINLSLLVYYKKLLNLIDEPEINLEIVDMRYYSIFDEIEHARDLGLRTNIDFQELIAAREYMCDMCRYYGNRN